MTLQIAFGVTALANGLQGEGIDGIGSVCQQLLHFLPQHDPKLRLTPFEFALQPSGSVPGTLAVGAYQRQALLSLFTGRSFSTFKQQLQGRVDLVHATDHSIPKFKGTPVLATLMDAIPLSHPQWVSYPYKRAMNEAWRRSAQWADHIVTISDYSKEQIAHWFRIPAQRISVIPLGVDNRWFSTPDQSEIARIRKSYTLPESFFLFVGTLQPRKNLEFLVRAHAMLPEEIQQAFPLIVVGRRGWGCDELIAKLTAKTLPNIHWLSYLPHQDLPIVMHLASALLFPSLYEGFGLPILEAFASQTAVIASNTTSLPEVAGDAALLLDPTAPSQWADAMQQLAYDPAPFTARKRSGLERAKSFSWKHTAQMLAALYRQVAA